MIADMPGVRPLKHRYARVMIDSNNPDRDPGKKLANDIRVPQRIQRHLVRIERELFDRAQERPGVV
jgi:hypothetical protein